MYHLFFPATHKDKQACNKITACLGHQEHLNNKLCLASVICDPPSLTFRLKKKQKQGWMMDGWLVGALRSKQYVHSGCMPFGSWDCVIPKITSNLSIVPWTTGLLLCCNWVSALVHTQPLPQNWGRRSFIRFSICRLSFCQIFLSFNLYFLTSGCSLAPTNVVSPALGLEKRALSMDLASIQRKNVALHKASCNCSEGVSYKRQGIFALKDISHK